MNLYAAVSPDFGPSFGFTAESDVEAAAMLERWNRYHSYYSKDTKHTVLPIGTPDRPEMQICNGGEWINLFRSKNVLKVG